MKRRMIWLAAIAGLLVVGLVGQAVAAEVAQRSGARFSCGEVSGDPVTVTGVVGGQNWNTLEVNASGTLYTVKTGPYKTGRNLPDLSGQTVTVEGYTAGQNCQAEEPSVNLIQARTITAGDDVYDLTQVPAGAGCGACNGEQQGVGNQFRGRHGNGQGGSNGQGGGNGQGGNGQGGCGCRGR